MAPTSLGLKVHTECSDEVLGAVREVDGDFGSSGALQVGSERVDLLGESVFRLWLASRSSGHSLQSYRGALTNLLFLDIFALSYNNFSLSFLNGELPDVPDVTAARRVLLNTGELESGH
jgi:hypothetical protein